MQADVTPLPEAAGGTETADESSSSECSDDTEHPGLSFLVRGESGSDADGSEFDTSELPRVGEVVGIEPSGMVLVAWAGGVTSQADPFRLYRVNYEEDFEQVPPSFVLL